MLYEDENNYLYVEWSPKFELGIPVIDEQHKKLVSLCNTFYQELMKNKAIGIPAWESSLTTALKECVDYVKIHFRDEEKLLIAANYTDYEKHKRDHEEFIQKILETSRDFDKATFTTAFHFVKFLYDWILGHIAHEDKLYVKQLLDFYRSRKAN